MGKKEEKEKSNLNSRSYSLLPKSKLGQFFLIAAVVIIVIIVSIVTVSNYTERKDEVKLYDLGEELGIEGQQVLDYGTYNALNEEDMKELMENFIENYVSYIGEGKNLYFLFGNQERIYVIGYQELVEEKVCVTLNPSTPVCGNSIVEGTEECDDGCLVGIENYCERIDSGDGCSRECEIEDARYCHSNDYKSAWEICDGDTSEGLGGESCETLGFDSGDLLCNEECEFDTTNCVMAEEDCIPLQATGETQEFPATDGDITKVVIRIGNIDYEFALKYGENFYFVIWQEISGEKYVITGE